MRKILIAGNWKMNGGEDDSRALASAIREWIRNGGDEESPVDIVVCPPYLHLNAVEGYLRDRIFIGAQDVDVHENGAFTGQVSATMLKEFCQYVIVGHSERRTLYGETNKLVAQKVKVVKESGMTPIFCVGETLQERNFDATEAAIESQLDAVNNLLGSSAFLNIIIAYEPVWAIGTGKTATPEQAQAVHAFIRDYVAKRNVQAAENVQILYGGSMNPGNAAELLAQPDIDGGLIGGASLKAEDFIAICKAGKEISKQEEPALT